MTKKQKPECKEKVYVTMMPSSFFSPPLSRGPPKSVLITREVGGPTVGAVNDQAMQVLAWEIDRADGKSL